MTRTCSDKVNSVPFLLCSNFQSSTMFEGSESVEVEGGSADSTVASSISACKKVKTETCLVCVLGWKCKSVYLCVRLLYDRLSTASSFCLFLCWRACPSYLSPPSVYLVVCFQQRKRFSFPPPGVPVTPRGCAIRGTAGPVGQPSRFIISQCQRDRRGNSTDQWAEVEARLNFLSKCV